MDIDKRSVAAIRQAAAAVPLLKGVSPRTLEAILPLFSVHTFDMIGESIIRAGLLPTHLFILVYGRVDVVLQTGQHVATVPAVAADKEANYPFFGEMGLIAKREAGADVRCASKPVKMLGVARAKFVNFVRLVPDFETRVQAIVDARNRLNAARKEALRLGSAETHARDLVERASPDKECAMRVEALQELTRLTGDLTDAWTQQAIWRRTCAVVTSCAQAEQPEVLRRQALWVAVNASTNGSEVRQAMWADDSNGGIRETLLSALPEVQPDELRVLSLWAMTNIANEPPNKELMWKDRTGTRALILGCASVGQSHGVRVQAMRLLACLASLSHAADTYMQHAWRDVRDVLVAGAECQDQDGQLVRAEAHRALQLLPHTVRDEPNRSSEHVSSTGLDDVSEDGSDISSGLDEGVPSLSDQEMEERHAMANSWGAAGGSPGPSPSLLRRLLIDAPSSFLNRAAEASSSFLSRAAESTSSSFPRRGVTKPSSSARVLPLADVEKPAHSILKHSVLHTADLSSTVRVLPLASIDRPPSRSADLSTSGDVHFDRFER